MPCACNLLLASIEKAFPPAVLNVDLFRVELSSKVNRLFNSDGVHGVLEGKDHQCINMSFLLFVFMWTTLLGILRMPS